MSIPQTAYPAPVNITRASHVVLTSQDLAASQTFYTDVVGLVVSARSDDALYLRGLEEACHHSLVLRRADGERQCARIGMRVFTDDELRAAADWFAATGCPTAWAEVPHQGLTLHATDPSGVPLELCATMPVTPRMITRFSQHRGGAAQRLDHYQILVPDVPRAMRFYMQAGFRLTEYIAPDSGDDVFGAFLQRKGNPHDIVFFKGPGPQLHHFAFTSPDTATMLHACDVAGELGWGETVERGPGRHGPGHALYTYFRDPDGHRVEIFNTHYQVMDSEIEPVRWDPADTGISTPWGLPARAAWFTEATPFVGTRVEPPATQRPPRSLERYLAGEA
jgi:catechol 2,3-dioxygenase